MRTSRTARRCADERGAAMVEFALVVPLFVFLLLGLIAFGLILALKQSVTQSAEEGARAAVGIFFVNGGPATVEDKEQAAYEGARQGLTWLGDKCCNHVGESASATSDPAAPLSISTDVIGCDGGTSGPGNECMRVRVDYPYKDAPLMPLPDGIPPFSFVVPDTLRSEAVVRVNS
ncbi:MAG: TadE family protein [Acidimicrobiales bacterium]